MYLFVSIRYRSINQPTNPDQRTHQPSPAPQHPHKAFVEVLLPACTHIKHLSVVRSNCKLTLSRYEYLLLLEETGQAALCVLPHIDTGTVVRHVNHKRFYGTGQKPVRFTWAKTPPLGKSQPNHHQHHHHHHHLQPFVPLDLWAHYSLHFALGLVSAH